MQLDFFSAEHATELVLTRGYKHAKYKFPIGISSSHKLPIVFTTLQDYYWEHERKIDGRMISLRRLNTSAKGGYINGNPGSTSDYFQWRL